MYLHQDIFKFIYSSKRSSNQLLKELHAHLLIPVIEQIEQVFKKKNKENQMKSIPTCYDFQTNYNPNTLRTIKMNTFTDDEPVKLINDECNEDQFIEYLEIENDVTLMINSKEKDIIIKLLQVKVIERKNQLMKLVVDKNLINI